jgi:hypothetical protein
VGWAGLPRQLGQLPRTYQHRLALARVVRLLRAHCESQENIKERAV